mgnify:CR=1 FL=1
MEENRQFPLRINRPGTLVWLDETMETVLQITTDTVSHSILEIGSINGDGNSFDSELDMYPIRRTVSGNRKRDGIVILL